MIGSMAGGKLGAVIGSLFGPVGSALGALVGGVLSAMLGGRLAAAWRLRGLYGALDNLHKAGETYRSALQQERSQLERALTGCRTQASRDWLNEKRRCRNELLDLRNRLQQQLDGATESFVAGFPARLKELRAQVKRETADVLAQTPASPFGWLYPRENDAWRALVRRWSRRVRSRIRAFQAELKKRREEPLEERWNAVRRFLEQHAFRLDSLEEDLDRMEALCAGLRRQYEAARQNGLTRLSEARRRLLEWLNGRIEDLYRAAADRLAELWNQVVEAKRLVQAEAAKHA